MILRPYYDDDHGCAAYVLGCGTLGQCAVIDARIDDVDAYATFANSKGMRIMHVIDTHVHADHRSGGRELAQRAGASYCLHESADVETPFTPLQDGQVIELDNTHVHERLLTLPDTLEIYPGHFSGSLCGAGLSGKPISTLAFERQWNPMLSMDREASIDALRSVPAKPAEMEQILAFNRGRPERKVQA